MAEYSLDWIIIRNSISVSFIFNKNTNFLSKTSLNEEITFLKKFKSKANNFFLIHILDKSLEGSSAISHTRLVRIAFLDSRLSCFFSHILDKSLEGSSAISHTALACPPDF